jgi:hypothetical protein
MLNKILRIIMVNVIIILSCAIPAIAADSTDVTITATPMLSGGITGFTIVYVSDTQLDLSWILSAGTDKIMIRAQYGEYPDDIPDENTAPSDGYLVYYGNGLSVSDTSMNFDENAGFLYYKAWAQKADGKWYVTTSTGKKESELMALLALLALGLGISWFAIAKRELFIGVIASAMWLAILIYTRGNPIGNSVMGDSFDNAIVAVFIALIGIVPFLCWNLKKQFLAKETKEDGFKQAALPKRIVNKAPREETSSDYYDRLNRITHPRR